MSFTLYEASAPVFVSSLQNMRAWLDKTRSEGLSTNILNARLAEDMKPLSAQYQMASDTAKNAMARLAGIDPPSMPDTETTIEELQERCDRTIAFVESADEAVIKASEQREVVLKFPSGSGYRWTGADYLGILPFQISTST